MKQVLLRSGTGVIGHSNGLVPSYEQPFQLLLVSHNELIHSSNSSRCNFFGLSLEKLGTWLHAPQWNPEN